MYGQADVTRTFSGKGIINKSSGANLIKIAIKLVHLACRKKLFWQCLNCENAIPVT
jgi:hypothetical protein